MTNAARELDHLQRGFAYRFDWGLDGLRALAPRADVVIVIDVLRFTSAVCTALEAGSSVVPYPCNGEYGATLSVAAREGGATRVLAGCLRNASATARYAQAIVSTQGAIAIIAAGERWGDAAGPLRPAIEDLIGAGAVIAGLDPSKAVAEPHCSPEAASARATFLDARPRLLDTLRGCVSGRELLAGGWDDDVATSAALDVTDIVAELVGDEFIAV